MQTRRFIGGLVLGAVLVSGCDGDDGETVGPRGGVITSEDGRVTLTIPPGALEQNVAVRIEEVDEGPEGTVGAVYTIEPEFLQLHRPAMIEYDVTAPEIDGAEALDLEVMDDVLLLTEKDTGWEQLADHDADLETGLITASVTFFGTIALVED